jgi:hypothetical protein
MRLPTSFVPILTVLLAVLVHATQTSDLGLYWDDAVQLVQPLHAVGYDPVGFVLADTGPSLRSERPLAYFAFAITRLAFLHGVPAVHWVLVVLLTANALLAGAVARRLVDEDWFALAAGVTFLCYPLAPLQPVWAATVHYHFACLFALGSILLVERGIASPHSRRRWAVLGAGAYAASLLTHEAFVLVAPGFLAARWLCGDSAVRRAITGPLLGFLGMLVLVAAWRLALLPAYGTQLYAVRPERLAPGALLPKAGQIVLAALFPWPAAVRHLRVAPETMGWLLWAAAAAILAGGALYALLGRARAAPPGWWVALVAGLAMLGGAAAAMAASPISLEYAFGPSYGSRGNFVALPGAAIALTALIGAPRLPNVARAALLATVVLVGALLHYVVKGEFVREWQGYRSRLATLRTLAPALADSTLIVIFDDRDRRAPYAEYIELSSYLLTIYDNWSLLANTTRHLRFYGDGVESTYHGNAGAWFRAGDRGAYPTATLQPVGRIPYDRLVLFRNAGGRISAMSDTVVTAEDGGAVLVRSNRERVRDGPVVQTPMGRRLLGTP